MLTKLKNLMLSSVDLVRRGANQEADICLFKSADEPEATAETPVMDNETALVYTGALAKSIQSIQDDDSLDDAAKVEMIQKSFDQFGEAVAKYNHYHDERGRFATASGGIAHATVANDGSTTNLRSGTSPKTGYMLVTKEDAKRGQQVAINKYWSKDKKRKEIRKALDDFQEKNKDVLREGGENGKFMGTWFDKQNGTLWLDVSTNFTSKSQAIKAANEAGEIAIWDVKAGGEIRLRDTHA